MALNPCSSELLIPLIFGAETSSTSSSVERERLYGVEMVSLLTLPPSTGDQRYEYYKLSFYMRNALHVLESPAPRTLSAAEFMAPNLVPLRRLPGSTEQRFHHVF